MLTLQCLTVANKDHDRGQGHEHNYKLYKLPTR